ncbi:MAG: hypothetical protein ACTSXQ_03100 [Alphaproteobacteria bacterium]
MKIIECFGPPGAGKTSIVKAYIKDSNIKSLEDLSKDFRAMGIGRKLLFTLGVCVKDLKAIFFVTRFLFTHKLFQASQIKRLYQLPFYRAYIRKFSQTYDLFLDEWIIQKVWAIYVKDEVPPQESLSEIFSFMYKGMNVDFIYFDLDESTAVKRLTERQRTKDRFRNFGEKKAQAILKEHKKTFQKILTILADKNKKVITINAENTLDENINIWG